MIKMSEITNEKLDAAETSNSNSSLDETVKRTKIGDIVLLKSPKIDVAGFALYKGGGILTLGFLDPNCRLRLGFDYDNLSTTGYVAKDSTDGSIKRSSRNYIIAKFQFLKNLWINDIECRYVKIVDNLTILGLFQCYVLVYLYVFQVVFN